MSRCHCGDTVRSDAANHDGRSHVVREDAVTLAIDRRGTLGEFERREGGLACSRRSSDAAGDVAKSVAKYQAMFRQLETRDGWPPRLKGRMKRQPVLASAASVAFGVQEQQARLRVALRHAAVRERLQGRWETLGCHLLSHKTPHGEEVERVRVCLFNYTTNELIEVLLENGAVCSVAINETHEHPESPVEMAQAIAIARAHPELSKFVDWMDAHAILRVRLDPHAPGYRHRCMHVMFTAPGDPDQEKPVLVSALVDLRIGAVIAFGTTPCGEQVKRSK